MAQLISEIHQLSEIMRSNWIFSNNYNLAAAIIEKAKKTYSYPLLDESIIPDRKYSHAVSNILFAEEEQAIYYFIGEEMVQLL